MQLSDGNSVLFLCDRKACGKVCPNKMCSHTADISHAKNFDFVHVTDRLTDYFEDPAPNHTDVVKDIFMTLGAISNALNRGETETARSLLNDVLNRDFRYDEDAMEVAIA